MIMKLEDHLQQLPHHSAENKLWDVINTQLSESNELNDRLPLHKAKSDLWYDIKTQLEYKTPRRTLRLRYISAAASIAVIVTLGLAYFAPLDREQLFYADELVMEARPIHDFKIIEVKVLDNCQEHPAVCNTPDFSRLQSTLEQLKQEELKLRALKNSTDNPNMSLYHSRIVKNIQQVEAQMLQMFS